MNRPIPLIMRGPAGPVETRPGHRSGRARATHDRSWRWPQTTGATCALGCTCPCRRFAARLSGLAFGLALAGRPAGSAEVSGAQGRVLKIVSAERLETIFGCLDAGGADPDNVRRSGPQAVTCSR